MADVDFGDTELFEQLEDSAPPVLPTHLRFTDDDEDDQEGTSLLRSRLEECDSAVQRLTEENTCLRRKLHILTRPSGITVEDVNSDGPVLQILYANNFISKQCRQEIEDCVCNVILKHQKPGGQRRNSSFSMPPQHSAFALDEDPEKQSSSSVRTTTEAFKVVGSSLYFTTFSVDKLGQPLLNENPQMTEGWEIPTYHQVFNQVIGTDGQDIEMKDKRPKSMCFNCGSSGHQLRDCPKPKDMAAINERRKEFNQNSSQGLQSSQRYHAEEVEERFSKYKPGIISEELLSALGIDGNTLPPLIYRMRHLGYPPGWLKEAEMENSGLALYDGNASREGENVNTQCISYDVSKLVDFPGFNVAAPTKMKDEYLQFGSIPMQSNHMKQNYAAYLSNYFTPPGAACNKRRHESESSPQRRKKTRSSPDRTSDRSSDMDIESDPGTPYHPGSGDFQFQPPLPPGSPGFSSPPPLPHGTPPATPTPPPLPKGTPPATPTNGSPVPRGRGWVVVDETAAATEDELTLEELEEQQRLIWAALENADNTASSDCSDTPAAAGTPAAGSSSGVSTPQHADASETEETEEAMDVTRPEENRRETRGSEVSSQSPGPIRSQEDSPQSPEPIKAQEGETQSSEQIKSQEGNPQSSDPIRAQEDSPQSPDPIRAQEAPPQISEPIRAQEAPPQSFDLIRAQEAPPQSFDPIRAQEAPPQSFEPIRAQDSSPQSPPPGSSPVDKITAVPHRSKFAAGIVAFEETPEFTEVAEATGTYLRIRDLLKSSPRSLSKKK